MDTRPLFQRLKPKMALNSQVPLSWSIFVNFFGQTMQLAGFSTSNKSLWWACMCPMEASTPSTSSPHRKQLNRISEVQSFEAFRSLFSLIEAAASVPLETASMRSRKDLRKALFRIVYLNFSQQGLRVGLNLTLTILRLKSTYLRRFARFAVDFE